VSDIEERPTLDPEKESRNLRRGLISAAVLVAVVVCLVLAVPGLHGVGHTVAHMQGGWIAAAAGSYCCFRGRRDACE
jgi:hypothetical protein